MDEEYLASKTANEIVTALLSDKIYQIDIDKPTYDAVYNRLLERYPALRPSIFFQREMAVVQFSGVSTATLVVTSDQPLTKESFTTNCAFKEGAMPLMAWPKALISDMCLLGWYLAVICPLGALLLAIQSPDDLHTYFTLIAQVLAIVFTLYAVLRKSFKNLIGKEFPDHELDKAYRAERVIGITAIGSIAICLLEFLLTSASASLWDELHYLTIRGIHLSLFRSASVIIGVLLIALLVSFFRSLVFYYPDKEFGQTLLLARSNWFEEQDAKAVSVKNSRRNGNYIE